MANKTVTVKTSGGDYTSLAAAVTGEQLDLVTNTRILTIECYSLKDTATVSIDGYTTSSSYYIKITSPVGQRHLGIWNTGKYYLEPASGHPITIKEQNVTIEFLQISALDTNTAQYCIFDYISDANATIKIKNNIFKGPVVDSTPNSRGVYLYLSAATCVWYIYNNLFITFSGSAIVQDTYANQKLYAYNNTIVNSYRGFVRSTGDFIAINNLLASIGFTSYTYVGTFFTGSDYNASDNDDNIGIGGHNRVSQTFTFVGASDYHLNAADAGAIGYGVSDPGSGLFSDDIDGETRTGTWDCGADQHAAAVAKQDIGFLRKYKHYLRR